ncbi:RNA polymerase sigma factor [Patescibacteria group bacterium]|nr:RNA polymerase sigma factor [Patescibacteria group bacterium]MDE1946275.1 RNA polymerase sigma factor [Patescibacteria group bacterium]MDE2010727.1 RNA polymerase sigma factor [Patescibacteria group bacterium]MDE2232611.1 RNA polymerase sigma factor [Patescibacteria group bacterium]
MAKNAVKPDKDNTIPPNEDVRLTYSQMDDESLVEACKKKDDGAFSELMRRYTSSMYHFAVQYAKNEEDAEDIAQDAFFKAWKYIQRFKTGGKFRPWIYAITRNTALDHLKKKRAFSFSDLDNNDVDLDFADTLEDPEPLPDKVFADQELGNRLDEAMSVLHPDHGAVLIMHYRDGMTFDEISVVLKKPMNTVKSWHRRALLKMRERLVQHHLR